MSESKFYDLHVTGLGYLNLRPFLFLHQVRLNQIAEIIEAHDVTSPWRIHLG